MFDKITDPKFAVPAIVLALIAIMLANRVEAIRKIVYGN